MFSMRAVVNFLKTWIFEYQIWEINNTIVKISLKRLANKP